MVVAAFFFALYAICVKFSSVEGIGSFEVLFYRSFFGLVIFYAMMRYRHITVHTVHPADHLIRSFMGAGAVMAGIYSIAHLNVGLAMTLNYTSPLFIGCFTIGILLSKHKGINWKLLSTLLLGFMGVVVMLSPTITPDEYFAAVVGLGSGFCTAVATTYVKRLGLMKEPELRILFYLVLVGSLCGLIGTMFTGGFTMPTATAAIAIAGFAICSTCGQFFLTRAFSRGNLVLSGALQYTVILFSTIMGVFVFDDNVNLTIVAGMVMIVISGILASYFTRLEKQKQLEEAKHTEEGLQSHLRHKAARDH
ncbi:MAG TPA: DMT family transporter [Candidatus Aphodousia faecavium]|nr:DMT family transporter [Candidatus Aphodousia faecavium]